MKRWLTVVGIGDDGLDGLPAAARHFVDSAEIIVGGERHLAMLGADPRRRVPWPKPFDPILERLHEWRDRAVCVLASGDPCCYGVGSILAEGLGVEAVRIIPAASAFSLACARLGWSYSGVETLSLHGRPLELLHPFVQPNAKLLVLSENSGTPAKVASLLCKRQFERSRITALSHLGGERESIVGASANEWPADASIADLNTVAIECRAGESATLMPRSPGLDDDLFEHDGQLTKREVRAVTIAALSPVPGQLLWDVGAGCGSVGIEWMRTNARCRAIAIEPNAKRLDLIAANASALGTPNIEVIANRAPAALETLPAPDAIFVGGGVTEAGLLDICWRALKPGGRLVANVVSIEGERVLDDWQRETGGRLARIAISRSEPIGRFRGWRAMMAVTQFSVTRP